MSCMTFAHMRNGILQDMWSSADNGLSYLSFCKASEARQGVCTFEIASATLLQGCAHANDGVLKRGAQSV